MQNVDAYDLTVSASIADKNIGQPKLLDEVRNRFRLLRSSKRTEEAYVGWIRRYLVHAKEKYGDWVISEKVLYFCWRSDFTARR